MPGHVFRVSCQVTVLLLVHLNSDWLANKLKFLCGGGLLGVWLLRHGSALVDLGKDALVVEASRLVQLFVDFIDVVLEPSKWRWGKLALWERT